MRILQLLLPGNPNVGKSTIFNSITGMNQHTGNWPGKTVANAVGSHTYLNKNFLFVDIPGTYSILSNSEEEEIARDFVCFNNPNATIVVVDATVLERNLNLAFQIMEITDNVIICVNLLDEAKKKKIKIDLEKLSVLLGVPVVGTIARKKTTLNNLINTVYKVCINKIKPKPILPTYSNKLENAINQIEKYLRKNFSINEKFYRWISIKLLYGEKDILHSIEKHLNLDLQNDIDLINILNNIKSELSEINIKEEITSSIILKSEKIAKQVCTFERENYSDSDRKIDKILTSKRFGIPIMILFLGLIFWLTIIGANYPSDLLFSFFNKIQDFLLYLLETLHTPKWISDMLIFGIFQTLTWIISVMLPPMAIFFPLFTFLEDLGYLPRIAFNMDNLFKKCRCNRKTNDYHVHGIWL